VIDEMDDGSKISKGCVLLNSDTSPVPEVDETLQPECSSNHMLRWKRSEVGVLFLVTDPFSWMVSLMIASERPFYMLQFKGF
jgi:hypothetical protein